MTLSSPSSLRPPPAAPCRRSPRRWSRLRRPRPGVAAGQRDGGSRRRSQQPVRPREGLAGARTRAHPRRNISKARDAVPAPRSSVIAVLPVTVAETRSDFLACSWQPCDGNKTSCARATQAPRTGAATTAACLPPRTSPGPAAARGFRSCTSLPRAAAPAMTPGQALLARTSSRRHHVIRGTRPCTLPDRPPRTPSEPPFSDPLCGRAPTQNPSPSCRAPSCASRLLMPGSQIAER